jgi:hypothetical protein
MLNGKIFAALVLMGMGGLLGYGAGSGRLEALLKNDKENR